jgi:membrane associated rhomboid family serine protease
VQENEHPSRRSAPPAKIQDGIACACFYAITLLLLDMMQRDQLFAIDWLGAGLGHAAAIQDGQWWRAATALGLHADADHLIGNLVFGAIFVFLAAELLGWGLALAGIVFGGTLGNLINGLVQNPEHSSIGASTSVFAAVGLLAAYTWSLHVTRLNRWVPLGGGIAVLAFIGMGGERTDYIAHIAGFASGCLLGFAFGALDIRHLLADRVKRWLGIGAAAFFVLAWGLAVRA